MGPPIDLTFITGNKNKLIESQAILGDSVVLNSTALDLPEIQGSVEGISADKCRRAAATVKSLYDREKLPILADKLMLRSRGPCLLRIPVFALMLSRSCPGHTCTDPFSFDVS